MGHLYTDVGFNLVFTLNFVRTTIISRGLWPNPTPILIPLFPLLTPTLPPCSHTSAQLQNPTLLPLHLSPPLFPYTPESEGTEFLLLFSYPVFYFKNIANIHDLVSYAQFVIC